MSIATKPPPSGAVPKRRYSANIATASSTGASELPRRSSCIPASSLRRPQFVDDGTEAAAGLIPDRPTTSVVRASAERPSQTATRRVSEPASRAYARRRTGGRGGTSSNGGGSWAARGDLAGKSSDGGTEEKRGRKAGSFNEPSPTHEPPSTKGAP